LARSLISVRPGVIAKLGLPPLVILIFLTMFSAIGPV
jgi:hypothetical protein